MPLSLSLLHTVIVHLRRERTAGWEALSYARPLARSHGARERERESLRAGDRSRGRRPCLSRRSVAGASRLSLAERDSTARASVDDTSSYTPDVYVSTER